MRMRFLVGVPATVAASLGFSAAATPAFAADDVTQNVSNSAIQSAEGDNSSNSAYQKGEEYSNYVDGDGSYIVIDPPGASGASKHLAPASPAAGAAATPATAAATPSTTVAAAPHLAGSDDISQEVGDEVDQTAGGDGSTNSAYQKGEEYSNYVDGDGSYIIDPPRGPSSSGRRSSSAVRHVMSAPRSQRLFEARPRSPRGHETVATNPGAASLPQSAEGSGQR